MAKHAREPIQPISSIDVDAVEQTAPPTYQAAKDVLRERNELLLTAAEKRAMLVEAIANVTFRQSFIMGVAFCEQLHAERDERIAFAQEAAVRLELESTDPDIA